MVRCASSDQMEVICLSHIGRNVWGKGEGNMHGYSFIICKNIWNDHFYTFWTSRKGPCRICPVWEKNSSSCLESYLGRWRLVWGWKGLTNLDKSTGFAVRMADGGKYRKNEVHITKNGKRLDRIEKGWKELKKTWQNWKRLDRIEKVALPVSILEVTCISHIRRKVLGRVSGHSSEVRFLWQKWKFYATLTWKGRSEAKEKKMCVVIL